MSDGTPGQVPNRPPSDYGDRLSGLSLQTEQWPFKYQDGATTLNPHNWCLYLVGWTASVPSLIISALSVGYSGAEIKVSVVEIVDLLVFMSTIEFVTVSECHCHGDSPLTVPFVDR